MDTFLVAEKLMKMWSHSCMSLQPRINHSNKLYEDRDAASLFPIDSVIIQSNGVGGVRVYAETLIKNVFVSVQAPPCALHCL